MNTHIRFKSISGDIFYIPVESYDRDVEEYDEAVRIGCESMMLRLEGGFTGWISEETWINRHERT